MEYEFHRGSKTSEAARNINDVYGANTTNDRTTRYWFAHFRSGYFDLRNEPRAWPEMLADNDELKSIVEADDSQTTAELAAAFEVSTKTILVNLLQIGKVKKLDKCVPHELNERKREIRVETCLALLNTRRHIESYCYLWQKWILIDNRKRSASRLDPGSVPKQCPKRKVTLKKVMVTIWCSSAGVIYHSFLPNGISIIADVYCEELTTIMGKLARLQPALVIRSAPLLPHHNA
ncbi:histone-lysine N-methyltransferase SETMAR-like [Melitaea cinxia]|uniref:histone-lysine N-methyltransferase SETMAR-like n=1 Tax=Melitaea cinxia TaxID=113334 RepID=UPI001E26F779|nr:histone-lysine N-methyltransferase SETMAR-like [Melitaea cinxia]